MALCSKIKPPSKEVVRNYPIKLVEVECLYKRQISPIRLWSLKLFVPLIIIVCDTEGSISPLELALGREG